MANNTVQTNSSLASGGRAIVSRRLQRSADGIYTVQAEFVCLPSYLSTHLSDFYKGATITSISTPNGTAKVVSADWRTENGLSYISAQFAAVHAVSTYDVVSISRAARSFAATKDDGTTRSFDYWASTVTITGNTATAITAYMSEAAPGSTWNERGNLGITAYTFYDWNVSEVKNANGITSYSATITGTYVYPEPTI